MGSMPVLPDIERLLAKVRRATVRGWEVGREIAVPLVRETVQDRISGLAAEVAFYGVLSLFPGLLMIAAALGSLDSLAGSDVAQRSEDLIVGFMERILTDQASGAIDAARALFEERNSGVLAFGALVALWSLSRGFAAAIRALNVAYDAEERRPWLELRATGLAMALGSVVLAVVMLAAVVLGPFLGFGRELAAAAGTEALYSSLWSWLRYPLILFVLIGWATTILHFAPSRRTAWRMDVPGAVLAAAVWILTSLGFSAYLKVASAGNEVFGLLGGGLILLVWLYLLSFGLLLGAELNQVLERRSDRKGG